MYLHETLIVTIETGEPFEFATDLGLVSQSIAAKIARYVSDVSGMSVIVTVTDSDGDMLATHMKG